MADIRFLRDPGYVYDLLFLFTLYFNRDYIFSAFTDDSQPTEDVAHLKSLLEEYGEIPEELLPFFYLKDNKKCCITRCYYDAFLQEHPECYHLDVLQGQLGNYRQVMETMLRFYFADITDADIRECMASPAAINHRIKQSDYSSQVKSSLYGFFLEPGPTVQKLIYELIAKDFFLRQRYEHSARRLHELQEQFSVEQVMELFRCCRSTVMDLSTFSTLYVSFCLECRNCIKIRYGKNMAVVLLGESYLTILDYLVYKNQQPSLEEIGNALADKNRIDILNLLDRWGEMTIRQIQRQLGMTAANAYYHLTLLTKAKVLRTQNKGRTILYSINRPYFSIICDVLQQYINE